MLKRTLLLLLTTVLTCLLCNCSLFEPERGDPAILAINKTMQTSIANNAQLNIKGVNLPANVNSALVPDMAVLPPQINKLNERFNISVNNVSARDFFMGLVKGTGLNMVLDPKITGTISLDLKKVTIQEALDAAHDVYGYQYKKTSYGYQVYPAGMQTRMFTVNYLNIDREGKSQTDVSSGQITQNTLNQRSGILATTSSSQAQTQQASSVKTSVKTDFWKDLKTTLDAIIGTADGRKVVLNPDSGIIIVKAMPSQLDAVGKYLDSIQSSMTRQVIIEAKILQVQLSRGYQAGVDWNLFGNNITQDGTQPFVETGNNDISKALGVFTNIFKLSGRGGGGSFGFTMKLLSTQGNVQVLSSPRIATLNNQKAVIKVGQDEFFITNVSTTTTASSTAQTSQGIDLTPFFSGVALDVTPQISADGEVLLHIHPIVSRVTEQDKEFELNGQKQRLPLALSQIRESDSIVKAKSGQVIIIGGLMENDTRETIGSTPFLDKIPYAAPLFRRTNQQGTKSELIILLKPIVVGQDTWNNELTKDARHIKHLQRAFHFGSHPKFFGYKGEEPLKKEESKTAPTPKGKMVK